MKMRLPEVVITLMTCCILCNIQVSCRSLQYVTRIALDRNRHQEIPFEVRSIYASFVNLEQIWVQLWRAADGNMTDFTLVWQYLIQPVYGNGSTEMFDLDEDQIFTIDDDNLKIGVINKGIPGPVLETYKFGNGVVMSDRDKDFLGLPDNESIPLNTSMTFDDLLLPYHIPVFFCNVTGCPEYLINPPTIKPDPTFPSTVPPPGVSGYTDDLLTYTPRPPQTGGGLTAALSSGDTYLLSTEVMIGLLAWNVVLTMFILGLIITVICICNDVEKLRRKARSLQHFMHTTPSIARPPSYPVSTESDIKGNRDLDPSWQSEQSMSSFTDDDAKLTKRNTASTSYEIPGVGEVTT